MMKAKRKRLAIVLIAISICLGVFFGGCQQKQTDPSEAAEEAVAECQDLLWDKKYDKVLELYDSMLENPEAIAQMEQQIQIYVKDTMKKRDKQAIVDIYNGFSGHEAVFVTVLAGINQGAEIMWEDSRHDVMILHRELMEAGVYFVSLDDYVARFILEKLEVAEYYTVEAYLDNLAHNSQWIADIHTTVTEKLTCFIQEGKYEDAKLLYGYVSDFNMELEPISRMIRDHAYSLMEQGDYPNAQYIFYMLRDRKDPLYDLDAQYMLRLSTMHVYMMNKQYAKAKEWVNSFFGETQDKLLEAFLECSADRKVIADLEAAILSRMDMAAAGVSELEQVEAERAALQQYYTMPFYDESLQKLVLEYLDGLKMQRNSLNYDQSSREYYKYYYYWYLGEANRYITLDALSSDYGFGSGKAQLEALLGTGEGLRQRIGAWNEIHGCLSGYLWDVEPYQDGNRYCLDMRNDTEYTFTFTVRVQMYGAYTTLLGEYVTEEITVAPGEQVQVTIESPEGEIYGWVFDWEIGEIQIG